MSAWIASLPVTPARFLPWKWEFWLNRKWQWNVLLSVVVWSIGTVAIVHAKEMIRGWVAIILVGLALDFVTWGAGKLGIWPERQVECDVSVARNAVIWAMFFIINVCLTWTLTHPADASTMQARYILIGYGVLINPVRFRINDELVFGQKTLQGSIGKLSHHFKKTKT